MSVAPQATDPALDAIVDAAAGWLVRLYSGQAGAAESADFAAWLARDVRHRHVWQQMEGALKPAVQELRRMDDGVRGPLVRRVLMRSRPRSRRAALYGLAALAAVGAGSAAVVHRLTPLDTLMAELRTATGERRQVRLADGSSVLLNARSGVDVRFSGAQRELRLRAGAVLVESMPDAQRPVVVSTHSGRVHASDARFVVEWHDAGRARVAALDRVLRLESASGRQMALSAGEVAWLEDETIVRAPGAASAVSAWRDGLLDLRDGTLGEVIEALRPYRAGVLRASEAASRLPVFGVFRLDDGERALRALAETLPISVSRLGPWITRIDLR